MSVQVLLRAARKVAKREIYNSCCAIRASGGDYLLAAKYAITFSPNGDGSQYIFWLDYEGLSEKEKYLWRLTALCLAAAMAGTGYL
jgi:hypothetical protein